MTPRTVRAARVLADRPARATRAVRAIRAPRATRPRRRKMVTGEAMVSEIDVVDFTGVDIRTVKGTQLIFVDMKKLADPRTNKSEDGATIYDLSLFFRCEPVVIYN